MSTNINSDVSTTDFNTVLSRCTKLKLFFKLYKKILLFIATPLFLMPIALIGNNNAYPCFYVFLITSTYWIFEVLHPAIISLIPIALSTTMSFLGYEIICFINIGNELIDCFGTLMFIVAIEDSQIHKRLAIKILLIFGFSHYRLCFLLFFSTMTISMWISNTLACGLMITLARATMNELEKMGILEVYETGKGKQGEHLDKNNRVQRPTDFTVFYILGIAYSSSVGGMASMSGSRTNQIFKAYSEALFPRGPQIEFPQFTLLTIPAVLLLETALYLWMNFYFLGFFRIHNYSALQTGSTEEETQYAKTLLRNQYRKLGKLTSKQWIVGITIILCGVLQITATLYLRSHKSNNLTSHIQMSAPTILCVLILFIFPTNLDFLKFCINTNDQSLNPLPSAASKPCLDWKIVRSEVHWSVILVTGASSAMFEALNQSSFTEELERFLLLFSRWSAPLLVVPVVVLTKVLTEFASGARVASGMMEHVGRLSVASKVNPHYLMLAAALSSALPFHLITGSPANAMVASYFNIPHRRMIAAGAGPTIFSILIIWFTVSVWSTAVWTDITAFPEWANHFKNNVTM